MIIFNVYGLNVFITADKVHQNVIFYIQIYVYIISSLFIYIYIYREREREREMKGIYNDTKVLIFFF